MVSPPAAVFSAKIDAVAGKGSVKAGGIYRIVKVRRQVRCRGGEGLERGEEERRQGRVT